MHGIPIFAAVLITGPETYPPVPIQISGLNSAIIFFASLEEVKVLETVLTFSSILLGEKLLLNPLIVIDLISKPACGTSLCSIPPRLPINKNSASFLLFFIYPAIASAGFMCPAVPPPASNTFIIFLPFF